MRLLNPIQQALSVSPGTRLPNINGCIVVLIRTEKEVDAALLQDTHIMAGIKGYARHLLYHSGPVCQRTFDSSVRIAVHKEQPDCFASRHNNLLSRKSSEIFQHP